MSGDETGDLSAPAETSGGLRQFLLANGTLLGAIGGLLGIATVVSALPLYATWVQPYLVFLLLVAGVLVWLELLAQWPPELMVYRAPPPRGTSWRLAGFAYAVQLTVIGFIGGFLWRVPRLVVLTLATVIGAGLWHFLVPERYKERRGALLLTIVVALLLAVAVTSLGHPTYRSILEELPLIEPYRPP